MFSPQSRLRHAVADTFAMVVYCSVVNMCIEVFLSGMSFEQSFYSRLVAIPVNILIAWPYGMYRDLFMRAARKVSPSGWIKNLADILAYVTFQSPVYVAILLVVGDLVSGGRRLASDYGGSQFQHRCFDVDGGGLWLLPRLLPPTV